MMNTNGIGNHFPLSPLQETSTVQKTSADGNAPSVGGEAASANGRIADNDQTNLSSASTLLAQTLITSDVRTDKVASLQQAIASGSYHVSSSDVADKMISSLLE